jgi:MFS family permease
VVASLIGRPLAGWAADRIGFQRMMVLGVISLIIGVAGVNMTTNALLLFVLRIFQTIGYMAFTTASNGLVAGLAPAHARKSMLTRFGAAANVAMTLTPATISFLLPWLQLNGALWVSAIFALIGGGLALQIRTGGANASQTSTRGMLTRPPRQLLLPLTLAAVCGIGYGIFLQFLPLLTERQAGLASGPVFAVYGVSIVLTRLLTARWMDQGDQRTILRIGNLLLSAGLFLFAIGQTWWLFAAGAFCVASGSGLQTGLLMNLHVEALPPAARGQAIAFYYLGFDLGLGGGALILAPVLQLAGVGALFATAAVIVLSGVLLLHWLPRAAPVANPA